jgi:hypothetical protein
VSSTRSDDDRDDGGDDDECGGGYAQVVPNERGQPFILI